MIYTTIDNASQFRDAFFRMGRGNQFSYDAFEALFDFYNDLGEDMELDVIAICCEWCKYESIEEAYEQLCSNPTEEEDKLEWLRDNHFTLEVSGGVLVTN